MRHFSNCLFFALLLYFRRSHVPDRYIVMRGSRMTAGPHFLYAELRRGKMRMISFKPTNPKVKNCPPPMFEGRARWGDSH